MVELTLRARAKVSVGSLSLLLAAASRSSKRRPTISHTLRAASRRPGSSNTGRTPTKPNADVSPGVSAMPCTVRLSLASKSLHTAVVASAPGAANCDDRVGAFGRHGDIETASAVVQPCRTASPLNVSRHQARGRIYDATPAHRENANTRLAHRDARNPCSGKCCEIRVAQPLAGSTQRDRRVAVGSGCQNTIAWIDDNKRFGTAVDDFDRVNRRNAIRSGRQCLPGLDA